MLRILTGLLALGMLLSGIAWATDSEYDIIDETDSPAYEGEVDYTYTEAGEPVPIDYDRLGMYFGTGDEFISGYNYYDYPYYTTQDYYTEGYVEGRDYHTEQIYYPGYYYGEGYSVDNVYGPMWGVPDEAVGLDGYYPEYYMYSPGSEQTWTPYSVERPYVDDGGDEEYVDQEDGLNISGSDDW
jgi:hypothetical protein